MVGRGERAPTRLIIAWLAAVALGMPALFVSALVAGFAGSQRLTTVYWVLWFALGLVVLAVMLLGGAPGRRLGKLVRPHSRQLQAFAKANGFTDGPFAVSFAGSVLVEERGGGSLYEGLRGEHGLPFRLGSVGSFNNDDTAPLFEGWAFLEITMPRELPHFFLVPQSPEVGDTVGDRWGYETSILKLEGDFNASFTLHVASGYETDSLYILTPDLMASLVDEAGDFFIESMGDRLVVISNSPFVGGGEMLYRRLFGIIDTVGRNAFEQARRYTDPRPVPAARVSVGRLRDIARPLIIVFGSVAALVLVPLLVDGVSRLG